MRDLNQEKEHMISIICPYTDEKVRREMLEDSLSKQTFKNFETIFLNNRELGLDRASSVLNYGAEKASGDILVFTHQDISLENKDDLKDIVYYCENYEFGIGAPAGVRKSDRKVFATVTHGMNKDPAGEPFTEPMVADACDECFFFIKKKDFLEFDELGQTWHFFAVDYSIRCRLNGKKVLLFPLKIHHLSPGWSLNLNYCKTLLLLSRKYRNQIDAIPTTIGVFDLNIFLPIRAIKRLIDRKFLKKHDVGVKRSS